MSGKDTSERASFVERCERDMRRVDRSVNTLLAAIRGAGDVPPKLLVQLESLRNKRDTAQTKLFALRRHVHRDWDSAREEFVSSLSEARAAWRLVLGSLDRECLTV